MLHEAGKEYGKNIIKQYSEKLIIEVGKKYNERNLRYMRQFYEMIESTKWNTMCSKLSWSHYREVLPLLNNNEILYYLIESERKNLSQRQLHELIKDNDYSRIDEKTKTKIKKNHLLEVKDLIKNPIKIKSNNLEIISEKLLQKLILESLNEFLFELGNGFCFVSNEYKIIMGDRYNYIDLLLFNIEYNCYVVIELKVTEPKKEHIGQIQVYMNYIDKNIKKINQNKTIGIIMCKKENRFVIEYSSDYRIAVREYELV